RQSVLPRRAAGCGRARTSAATRHPFCHVTKVDTFDSDTIRGYTTSNRTHARPTTSSEPPVIPGDSVGSTHSYCRRDAQGRGPEIAPTRGLPRLWQKTDSASHR